MRPRDAADLYGANPRGEFRRLAENGALLPLAPGYFAIVPRRWVGRPWQPDLNAVALGIAQADYGAHAVALTNVSAAREHGAIARAVAAAAVAVPVQRPMLRVGTGTIHFTKRTVARIDVQAVETELVAGLVTTPEQTFLDLADRPTFGGMDERQTEEALRSLVGGLDWSLVEELARPQRKVRALERARRVVGR